METKNQKSACARHILNNKHEYSPIQRALKLV